MSKQSNVSNSIGAEYKNQDIKISENQKKELVTDIPYKNSQTELEQYGPNLFGVMLLFLLIAGLVLLYVKKFMNDKPSLIQGKQINILEKTKVSARVNLVLVECRSKVFLCSQSMDQISLIAEIQDKKDE